MYTTINLYGRRGIMCGISGVRFKSGEEGAVAIMMTALFSLGHRGGDSAGFAVSHNGKVCSHIRLGDPSHLRKKTRLSEFPGSAAIGHVRYRTDGTIGYANAQPIIRNGEIAIAHNGQISWVRFGDTVYSIAEARKRYGRQGVTYVGDADTELLMAIFAESDGETAIERVTNALKRVIGTYQLLILWDDYLIAACDPFNNRPLTLGQLPNGGYIFTSETCTFGHIENVRVVQDVTAGQLVSISPDMEISSLQFATPTPRHCAVCHVYFGRPDSMIFGKSVSETRQCFGKTVMAEAIESGLVTGDEIIVPVPDSGNESGTAAADMFLSYRLTQLASEGVTLEQVATGDVDINTARRGLIRAHLSRRNFLLNDSILRAFGIDLKHAANSKVVEGRRVWLVDDSLIRGTTMRALVRKIRQAGATWVGVLIASPPVMGRCHMGINIRTRGELIAVEKVTIDGVRQEIGADALYYLSMKGFMDAFDDPSQYCFGCFNGDYPIPIPPEQ